MKTSKLFWLISFSPLILTIVLVSLDFHMNTAEMLSIVLQVVWGVLVSLGGGIIYLAKVPFRDSNPAHKFRKNITVLVKSLCFPMIVEILIFIFIALLFPARGFLSAALALSSESYATIVMVGESSLFSFMLVPTVFSILVGAWCIYLAVFHEPQTP